MNVESVANSVIRRIKQVANYVQQSCIRSIGLPELDPVNRVFPQIVDQFLSYGIRNSMFCEQIWVSLGNIEPRFLLAFQDYQDSEQLQSNMNVQQYIIQKFISEQSSSELLQTIASHKDRLKQFYGSNGLLLNNEFMDIIIDQALIIDNYKLKPNFDNVMTKADVEFIQGILFDLKQQNNSSQEFSVFDIRADNISSSQTVVLQNISFNNALLGKKSSSFVQRKSDHKSSFHNKSSQIAQDLQQYLLQEANQVDQQSDSQSDDIPVVQIHRKTPINQNSPNYMQNFASFVGASSLSPSRMFPRIATKATTKDGEAYDISTDIVDELSVPIIFREEKTISICQNCIAELFCLNICPNQMSYTEQFITINNTKHIHIDRLLRYNNIFCLPKLQLELDQDQTFNVYKIEQSLYNQRKVLESNMSQFIIPLQVINSHTSSYLIQMQENLCAGCGKEINQNNYWQSSFSGKLFCYNCTKVYSWIPVQVLNFQENYEGWLSQDEFALLQEVQYKPLIADAQLKNAAIIKTVIQKRKSALVLIKHMFKCKSNLFVYSDQHYDFLVEHFNQSKSMANKKKSERQNAQHINVEELVGYKMDHLLAPRQAVLHKSKISGNLVVLSSGYWSFNDLILAQENVIEFDHIFAYLKSIIDKCKECSKLCYQLCICGKQFLGFENDCQCCQRCGALQCIACVKKYGQSCFCCGFSMSQK